VIGVNRTGEDGNGYPHSGDSCIIDPPGKILFQKSHDECIHTATLSWAVLQDYREAFPAWRDADAFGIRNAELGVSNTF
jgi:predicted amidohydrolase